MLIKSVDDINKLALNVNAIIFLDAFNQHIKLCEWPTSLTYIEFGDDFNSPVSEQNVSYLPLNLTHLIFGYSFNQVICAYPLKLTHVHYGDLTNSPISNLPDSLQYMSFYNINHNNHHIEFPNNLTHLRLGCTYNHPLDNLPQSLTHLVTPELYNIELTNLPPNLIYLRLCATGSTLYAHPLHIAYLTKLESLILGNIGDLSQISFPDNLNLISFMGRFSGDLTKVKWPSNLGYIVDGSGTITIESSNFPTSLCQIIHRIQYVSGIVYLRDTGKHTKGAIKSYSHSHSY
jgi:hypothetical protein